VLTNIDSADKQGGTVQHGFGHTSQVPSSSDSDNPAAGLSELEVALLSIRPMTGYEILRHHARALEPWWETPRTQIYPKLRELQRRGLIEHEYVVQESKPNKRLYSIGPAGSEALASWLGSTISVPEMRHHMMMRLFLGNLLPIEETSRLLIGYRDRMAARAESFRQARERFSRSGPTRRWRRCAGSAPTAPWPVPSRPANCSTPSATSS
jgi:DNA-binding PadR family transcriptional regulator